MPPTPQAYGSLFRDRLFIVMVLVAGLMFATLFAYISGAPFVLQDNRHMLFERESDLYETSR